MRPSHMTRGLKRKVCEGNADTTALDDATKSQIQTLLHPRENTQDGLSQSSIDLFSSQSSQQQSSTSNNSCIRKQLNSYTWVQCDNPECQKWRRVKSADINHIGPEDKWFCYMNTDHERSWCEAAEEDYKFYDKLARKAGVKFVMSQLNNGSVVWAKMSGYCRWPALVTKDPSSDCHVIQDTDGDVLSYHVEFLGRSHSHNWISSKQVTAYGKKEDETLEISKKERKRGVKSRKFKCPNYGKKLKRTYKNMNIEQAIKEANDMVELSVDARLALCKFVPIPAPDTKLIDEQRKQLTCSGCRKTYGDSSQPEVLNMRREPYSLVHRDSSVTKSKTFNKNCSVQTKSDRIKYSSITQPSDYHKETSKLTDCRSPQIKLKDFSTNKMKFGSTLIDKTKEEKFKIDIEMYRKNERAFEHDVRRFMIRNSCKIGRLPCWQSVDISLFQLFLAVFERGGYEQVCRNRGWASVFREVTDTYNTSYVAGYARKYYYKNLYPYELYVEGKEYKHLFKTDIVKPKQKQKKTVMNLSEGKPVNDIEVEKSLLSSEEGASETSNDLDALLRELEGYSELCEIDTEAYQLKEKSGLNVTLYDDSPDLQLSPGLRMADTASEFGCATFPGENAQQVPENDFFSSDSDGHDLILHEMQALDNEMAAIKEELSDIF